MMIDWFIIFGLVLNVIGSLVFIIDSNHLSGFLAKMVGRIAEGYGMFDAKVFSKTEIHELQ